MDDERHMRRCLELAASALAAGEVPVGAVIVRDSEGASEVIGEGAEGARAALDHTAHAEVRAVQAACKALGSSNLSGLTLYSTVEPCVLCAYVIRRAGLARVVFGIPTAQAGGYTSSYALLKDGSLTGWPPLPEIASGMLAAESQELMRTYSRAKEESFTGTDSLASG